MNIDVELRGLERLKTKFGTDDLLASPVKDALESSAIEVQRQARTNAPKFRNLLTGSIAYELTPASFPLMARIGPLRGPTTPYAKVMEFGRRPGAKQPPVAAIAAWAKAKGIPPFVLAMSIARKGIKGRFYMKRAAEGSLPFIRSRFAKAARDVEVRFSR